MSQKFGFGDRLVLAVAVLWCGLVSVALAQAARDGMELPKVATVAPREFSIHVGVDGAKVVAIPGGVEIPYGSKRLVFTVHEERNEPRGPNANRLRFKLEGVDSNWVPREGEMGFSAMFFDASDRPVTAERYSFIGESAGWRGSIDGSEFTHRVETLTVPSRARSMRLVISSAGPPDAVGVLLVKNIVVSRLAAAGKSTQVLLDTKASSTPGPDGDVTPPGWIRDGINPSMAAMVPMADGAVFGIVDTDRSAHAEWHLIRENSIPVEPGEHIEIAWDELFSIGLSDVFTTAYGSLDPGTYRFLISETDPFGNPLPGETSLMIKVPGPYWRNPWFWALCAVILGVPGFLVIRAIIHAKVRRQLERAEQARLVEAERVRIARDIHDDLGARLTHISLLSGMAENEAGSTTDKRSFEKISEMTRELVGALYQTVWTVNPENDQLESLVSFLGQLAHRLCEDAGIRCRVKAPDVPGDIAVTSDIRHNTSMAVKEAVHNAIKYAKASEIRIEIGLEGHELSIKVEDDGVGFDLETAVMGCGLNNMRERMQAVGGAVSIQSKPGEGTRIQFKISL